MDTPRGGAGFSGYCVRVFEVDGECHARRVAADARRDRVLREAGWRVLRLDAALVMGDLEAAVGRVRGALA